MLCKFKDILGKPFLGFHKIHFGNVALFDLLLTLGIAIGLSYIPKSPPLTIWLIILFLIAMFLHILFCVNTSVNNWMYGNIFNKYLFGAFLIFMGIWIIFTKIN